MTAEAAIKFKGLDYERVDFAPGKHAEEMPGIYGEGNHTVPGMLVDDEPVHGSRAILARLEDLAPEPTLFPSDEVREAEEWGDTVLQDLGRRIPWGTLYWCPQAMGTMGGVGHLDPAGTDFAIKMVRAGWRYHQITAVRLHEDLNALPGMLDHCDDLVGRGVIGGEQPNAADLQIGATLRVLSIVRDLGGLMDGRPCVERVAMKWFPEYNGELPAGSLPAGWVPSR